MAFGGNLSLHARLHPSMKVPFELDLTWHIFKISPESSIMDLMDDCENRFEEASKKAGTPLELQINVVWNVKDQKRALNPREKVGQHFGSGETFGVYGDMQPLREQAVKAEEEKTPVTVLTGFLGAGKTTLLNYILQEQQGQKKIAVIENEFGEISIDDALLTQQTVAMAEKVVVMDNGCVCCTIRGDLVKGLMQIMEDSRVGGEVDLILVETTGMADPAPVVRTFMSNRDLASELRLDAVVAMVDAKNIIQRLDDEVEEGKVNEAYQQVAFADKIILNKLDLVSADEAILVKDRLRQINKFAKVLPAVRGRVKIEELINIRAHDIVNFASEDIEREADTGPAFESDHGACSAERGHSHGHEEDVLEEHGGSHGSSYSNNHGMGHSPEHGMGHYHVTQKSRHDVRVNSFAIAREGEIIQRRLTAWMESIGRLPPERGTIFRIKAILAVKGHPYKHVFHAVMDVTDEDDAGPWAEGEKRISKIVFIGKSMDEPFLRAGFAAIFE